MEFHFVKAEKFNNVLNESYARALTTRTVKTNPFFLLDIDEGGRTKFKWK